MSVFLERQTVKKKKLWIKHLRKVERILISLAIVFVGIAALFGLYRITFMGRVFTIDKIVIEGDWKHLDAERIGKLAGVSKGDNLFYVSVSDVHQRISQEPWVESVAVRRKLPDTIWIYVNEFQPIAIVASSEMYYVNADGRLFKRVDSQDFKDLPVFTNVVAENGVLSSSAEGTKLSEMLEILKGFEAQEFGKSVGVASIDFHPVRGYSLITAKSPMQIVLGRDGIADRLSQLDRMGNEIMARSKRVAYMIADESGRIVVKYRT